MLKKRAESGEENAMYLLGLCYEFGIGETKDIEQAERIYKELQEKGNVVGTFLYKHCCQNGRGSGPLILRSSDSYFVCA